MTQEWATWDDMYQDDMYQYVEDANPKFETSNLSADSFARVHANVLLVGRASGRMVNARGFDLGNRQFAAAPADVIAAVRSNPCLVQHKGLDATVAGILLLPEGPMIVAPRVPSLPAKAKVPFAVRF